MRKTRVYTALFGLVTAGSVGIATVMANTVTVAQGQSMWSIAHENGIAVQALEAANPSVNPNLLQIGTKLQVPERTTYVVRPGDTLFTIGKQRSVSVSVMESLNPSVNPTNLVIGSVIHVPASQSSAVSSHAVAQSTASSNLYWMEHVINAEAAGENLETQIAVGDVILHRLQAGTYGSTVRDVVFQIANGHYQFTSVENGYIYTQPTTSSIRAAKEVLDYHDDVVPGAMVFYNPAKTPASSWVRSQPYITSIGHFVFAK